MCMIHITVRRDLLSHSNTTVRDFNLMATLCLLILSHQSLPLPTQHCRMVCLPPPHHCRLCPCVCPWTQTWTTHTPVPAITTAMKMWAMVGAGKGRCPQALYASISTLHT